MFEDVSGVPRLGLGAVYLEMRGGCANARHETADSSTSKNEESADS